MAFANPDGATPDGSTALPAPHGSPAATSARQPRASLKQRASALIFSMLSMMMSAEAIAASSIAPDGVALTGGYGRDVDIFGVALNWNFGGDEGTANQGGFETRLIGQIAYWRGTQRPTEHGSLWDFGLMPALRWTAPGAAEPRFFAEAGVGVNLLTATRINNDRVFSTAFQFGEQGGLGVSFGQHNQYELELYVQHVSNARIKEPNDGLTYVGLLFRIATR
jgi:hypothetical protein